MHDWVKYGFEVKKCGDNMWQMPNKIIKFVCY